MQSSAQLPAPQLPAPQLRLRVARTVTSSHADAEDLVQETPLRAYRVIDRFDGRYPRAWLPTINDEDTV